MGRIKDLNSALPTENDAFVFDGSNGTKRLSYAEFKQKLIDDGFGSGSSEAVVLTQAEYDALPDEVKDSDTIFFISDAPFENSNVVTLTRAEYDALSDATKMDGRFYYITDEAEVAKSLVVQNNVNSTETVPSSAVVYGLKSDTDSQISDLNNSLTPYMCDVFYEVTPGADVTFNGDIVFNKVATNIGGCYSTSTGRFTCPVNGIYIATFSYFSNSNLTNQRATIRKGDFALIQKNGPYGGSISAITYCTAGQYLTAGSASSTYPLSLFAYSGHNRFCVSLLRAC